MRRKIICLCNLVEAKDIEFALKKGARTLGEVGKLTGAGLSCGRCIPEIEEIINRYKKNEPKDLQKKLDFGF